MNENYDRAISKNMTTEELVVLFRQLKADARHQASECALASLQLDDQEKRELAMFHLGQYGLLRTIVWALSGEAENEGVDDPTVNATIFF